MGLKKYSLFGAFILLVGALIFSGCGKDTNKDTLKVGAMSYAETLEPTENYLVGGLFVMELEKISLNLMIL